MASIDSTRQRRKRPKLIPDQGYGHAEYLMRLSQSQFQLGDSCYYLRNDGEYFSSVIVGRYELYRVLDPNGPYKSGRRRFSYLRGYVVDREDGERHFASPHQLYDEQFKITHIRLVHRG